MTKRKGRPPKAPADRLSARITVHATQEQREDWEARAKEAGLSLSAWLVERGAIGAEVYASGFSDGHRAGVRFAITMLEEMAKP